ncbi:hypothetical protein [Hyphomicrobium sp.]|uniref:hypothetical protein n=1 Tax=Hyphomicrobium sp. TaxID=82 RepID=UPI002C738AEE|nr:hypothetical protein [Hyphomicrobium sp.]HRN89673.1 hypothetical protein [Hyphomicrobium sp.]HRQ25644.1 hypothetical protein [Hyphomicrobium sp.]
MSLEPILDVIRGIAMADSMSYWLIGTLTAVAFVLMRAMLPVKSLAFVFAPAVFWGGLTGLYAARQLGIVVASDEAVHTIVVSTAGMIAALFLMMCLVRLADAASRTRQAVTNSVARARV